MKIRKLMSGMLAGVMAVSSSMVCQMPVSAVSEDIQLLNGEQVDYRYEVDLSSLGKFTDSSEIVITATVRTGLTYTEDGEEKPVEDVFGVILDEDWNNKLLCSYNSEQGEYTMTVTNEQLAGKKYFILENYSSDDTMTVSITARGFEEDDREALTPETLTANTYVTVDSGDWLVGKHAYGSLDLTELNSAWKDVTIRKFREMVKSVTLPAQTYLGDSIGIGADKITQQFTIQTDSGEYNSDVLACEQLDTACTAYVDTIFRDDSHDSEKITGLCVKFDTKIDWDGSIGESGSCVSYIEEINALDDGAQIKLNFVEDNRTDYELPQPTGTVKLLTYDGEGWLTGCTAGIDYDYDDSDLEDITYGVTTLGEYLKKHGAFKFVPAPFHSSSADGLTIDMMQQNIVMYLTKDGEEIRVYSENNLTFAKGGVLSLDEFNQYSDYTITRVCCGITLKNDWDDTLQSCICVCPSVRDMTPGSPIVVELTEDTRNEAAVPAQTGTCTMYQYSDSSWLVGSTLGIDIDFSIDGVTPGVTTLTQLHDMIKSINIPAMSVSSTSLEGLTGDMLTSRVDAILSKDGGTRICSDSFALTSGGTTFFDDIYDESYADSVVEQVVLRIEAATEPTADDPDKSQAVSEAVRNLEEDAQVTITFAGAVKNGTETAALKNDKTETNDRLLLTMPSYGRYSTNSSVTITCTTPASMTQENEDAPSVIEDAETAFVVVLNNDWDNELKCPFIPGQTSYSMTLTPGQLKGVSYIDIVNRNLEEISVSADIYGYTKENRSAVQMPVITDNPVMTVEKPDWLEGSRVTQNYDEPTLSSWVGKTIGELRQAVGSFKHPANEYHGDTANAGADAFCQAVYVATDSGWYFSDNGFYDIDKAAVTYMDEMFSDNSHDSEVIEHIGTQIGSRNRWDSEKNKNVCISEKLNALDEGDAVQLRFKEDSRTETLAMPGLSGTVTIHCH